MEQGLRFRELSPKAEALLLCRKGQLDFDGFDLFVRCRFLDLV